MKLNHLILLIILLFGCTQRNLNQADHQVFRYNESKGITTLDPAFARSLPLIWPTHQLYNGLVQLDNSLNVKPCIASKWCISDDGRVYTFFLRNDVRFHESVVFEGNKGRKVVANDFVFSFQRIKDPLVASPGSWVFSMVDRRNDVGFKAINDSVLQITLSEPFPAFLSLLSMPYCSVVPPEAIEYYGKEFRSNPVGTGPFYLKLWREGEKLVLRKNINYFEFDSTGKRLPYLDAIDISFIADKQSEFMEFIKGNLDFLSGVHPVSKDELLTRTGVLNPKYSQTVKIITGQYLNTEYLGILVDTLLNEITGSPLSNIFIRRAIGYGIDREKLIMHLRNNNGYPGSFGFVPIGMPDFYKITKGFSYNPELVRELLEEAGYPGGTGLPPITLSTTDDYVDICEFIQHQLNEFGFNIQVEVYPGAAYRDMLANSKLTFFRGSWIADYADPENYLSLFYSKNFSPSGPNYTHFSNKEYDQLYEKSFRINDFTKRQEIFRELDSLVIRNAIAIPIFYDKVIRFVNPSITGMTSNPMNLLNLKEVKKIN